MRYRIKGQPSLYKDSHSKAVISTDKSAVEKYRIAREHKKAQISEINSLKAEIKEIKDLLQNLLEERK
jgi:hypothetical protein